MDDFKKLLFGVLGAFVALIVTFILLMFVFSCGSDLRCQRAVSVIGTPIPTLIPATLPAPQASEANAFDKCQVKAMDLLGAWVDAGAPEAEAFPFTDMDGNACQGTFQADVWPLLNENNIWFSASLSCTSCHNNAFGNQSAGLDLTSYEGILAGSQRSAEVTQGTPILAQTWTASLLYQNLSLTENIPLGHPASTDVVIYAGTYAPPAAATP